MPSSGWIRSTSTFGLVHSTGVSRKSVNGARLNCTRYLGATAREPLAGAQIEGHAGPPPVVDHTAACATNVSVRESAATFGSLAVAVVLRAHDVVADVVRGQRR